MATARLTLTIPARGIMSRGRSPQFISPSTTQAVVTVNAGAPQTFSLSPTGPNCTSVTGGTACNLSVPAPIGPSVAFAIVLEDGSSNALSGGSFTAAIAEGTSNVTFPLLLGGVPKTLDVTSSGTLGAFFTVGGGAQTATLVTSIKDAAGDYLIGNEPFVNASGATTPITITATVGGSISYAVEPYGGTFGTANTTFTLNAPSDTVRMAFSGSGVPPGFDTLTYSPSSVQSVAYGSVAPNLGIGVVWQAPFVPLTIAPVPLDVAASSGVQHGAVVTDGAGSLAVVGGGSCTASGINTFRSIALDGGAAPADNALYAVTNSSGTTYLSTWSLPLINSGTCSTLTYQPYSSFNVGGIVRASDGTIVYFATNFNGSGAPELKTATSTAPTTYGGGFVLNNPVGGLALRIPQGHVFNCVNQNGAANIAVEEYELPLPGSPTTSSGASASSGTGQTASCAGIAVDGATGRLVIADIGSNIATRYATNAISAQGNLNLTGTTIVGSQSIDFQSAAAGNWKQTGSFFINTTSGIEVFPENPPLTQETIIKLVQAGLGSAIASGSVEAIAYGDDQRLWITLSSGYVVAVPTY
jgi:hypothetical protein